MNNNQNQFSQPPAPTQDVTPPIISTPTPNLPPVAPPQMPKSKKGLVIGIVAGVVGLLLILAAVTVVLFTLPRLQRVGTADSFLKAVTAGDVNKAVSYTDGESNRQFITQSAEKLKNASYKLSDSDFRSEGDSYYLYAISGSSQKSARVSVALKDGHNIVTSLVYSPSQLKLVPGAVAENDASTTEDSNTNAAQCFAPNDYNTAFGYSNTLSFTDTTPYTTNAHFLTDSLEYDSSSSSSNIGTVASIVTTNPGKGYTIHLYGSVATAASADKDFANQRATKVKNELVAKGVSAGNIVIDEPQNVDSMGGATDEVAKQTARSVVIKFMANCSGATTTSTGR